MQHPFGLASQEWSTLRQLLDEALAMPPAERGAWLNSVHAQSERLAPALHCLLAHAQSSALGDLLNTLPKVETAAFADEPPAASAAADNQVGP